MNKRIGLIKVLRERPVATLWLAALLAAYPASGHSMSADKDALLDALLRQMTVQEKIGQLRMQHARAAPPSSTELDAVARGEVGAMFTEPGITPAQIRALQQAATQRSRLRIPLFFAGDVVHGQRTIFPINLGQASSWDLDAIASAARVAAIEGSADGLDMTFAPVLDISRDPRWGRMSEGYGEDTYLAARIAQVVIRALQGPTLGASNSLMACVKHFAGYGAVEGGRDYNTTDMSERRLAEDHLPPFKAAVDAGAGAVMTALTSLNGVPATTNRWLLQDVLRRQWQFNGLVISDHGAVAELTDHGIAEDGQGAAEAAFTAGTQMSMSDRYFARYLPSLIKQGLASEQQLDAAVRQVLETWFSGTEGGNAIADVLFGDYNPSGKLPVTFPRSAGQIPMYYNHLNTGRPFDPATPSAYRSRYYDIDDTPLYPFGFGLSYTRFSVSPPRLSSARLRSGQDWRVAATVCNEGTRSGETVVQLYVRDRSASVSRPVKQLIGFEKLLLEPGQTREVVLEIPQSALGFMDRDLRHVDEPGWFDVMVGLDSQALEKASFQTMP